MRKQGILALTLFAAVLLAVVSKASGQQRQTAKTPAQPQSAGQQASKTVARPALPPGMRTLTLQEGRAIVQKMAWADDEEGLSPDCSHLVHTLYEQAGYPYTYATSLDLYSGAESFVRVRAAHPGDLIVWRGHVGIVISPKQHSFFSTTSAGARIAYYDSAYWRARGYARFYRYLTSRPLPSGGKPTLAANRPPEQAPRAGVNSSDSKNAPSLQPVKTVAAAEPGSKTRTEAAHSELAPVSAAHNETAAAKTARADSSWQITLPTGGKPPKAADVTSALKAANADAGEILRASNLEQLERPVVIYRDLQVAAVEVKGRHGTAKVQFEALAALSAKRMEAQQGREEHQLELQRTNKGWMMTPPNQNTYVPRDAALRILAARLAALTQATETSAEKEREQSDIIRFMNLLIE